MSYQNFDIHIESSETGYHVRIDSPMGHVGEGTFVLPFSNLEIENYLLRFASTASGVRRIESPQLSAGREFGQRLFVALFTEQVYARFTSCLDQAHLHNTTLRIRLDLQHAQELAVLPWELLYDPHTDRFLSLSRSTPVIRFLLISQPIAPLIVERPLKVLGVISSPSDFAPLNVSDEQSSLEEATSALEGQNALAVHWLERSTLNDLRKALSRSQYHILHFVGHGYFDDAQNEGALVFEQENGRARLVGASALATILRDNPSIRMVVLNACEGARAGTKDQFAGVAQSLLRAGLPAVIAMQFPVSDRAAVVFTREFYASIMAGRSVDAALTEARLAMFADDNSLEWMNPVLFSRQPDSQLFELAADKTTTQNYVEGSRPVSVSRVRKSRKQTGLTLGLLSLMLVLLFGAYILQNGLVSVTFRSTLVDTPLATSRSSDALNADVKLATEVDSSPSAVSASIGLSETVPPSLGAAGIVESSILEAVESSPTQLPTAIPSPLSTSSLTEQPALTVTRAPTSTPTELSTATATVRPSATSTKASTATPLVSVVDLIAVQSTNTPTLKASNTPTPTNSSVNIQIVGAAETASLPLTSGPIGGVSTNLNVRSGPGVTYPIVNQLSGGALVSIEAMTADSAWLKVRLPDGSDGWVSAQYVQLNGSEPIQIVPTLATPTQEPPSLPNTPTAVVQRLCGLPVGDTFGQFYGQFNNQLGCAIGVQTTVNTISEQLFEGGHLFWRKDTDNVYIIYDRQKGGGELFEGVWDKSIDPDTGRYWSWAAVDEPDPNGIGLTPPSGFMEPIRGFGWLWRTYLGRENGPLGWALDRAYGFDNLAQAQDFENGTMFRGSDAKQYILLYNGKFYAR